MTKAALFLGIPLDEVCVAALNALDPAFKQLYIQDEATCLNEIIHQEQRYLGKKILQAESLAALELVQDNIYSLLKKLLPGYPFSEIHLQLLPILENHHAN